MYKIGIIGYGHVGKAMHYIFGDWVTAIYDPYIKEEDIENYGDEYVALNSKIKFSTLDLAIVCVMTAENKDGSCDLSIVEESVKWLSALKATILIKSAVTPGTTDKLVEKYKARIAVSPEYFGESKYYLPPEWSPKAWPFHIFGGDKKLTAKCVEIFKPLFNPRTFYYQTDAKTAEMIKYAENVWGATKVTWANEFYEICKSMGINYDEMREGWALDPRVEKMHTSVFENNRGFGGKCFPKDLKAIIKASEDAGYEPKFLKEVWASNQKFRDGIK